MNEWFKIQSHLVATQFHRADFDENITKVTKAERMDSKGMFLVIRPGHNGIQMNLITLCGSPFHD